MDEYKPLETFPEFIKNHDVDISSLNDEQLKFLDKTQQDLSRAHRNAPILFYKPLGYQIPFHKAKPKIRFIFGGNKSGKTECGATELVWLMEDRHPWCQPKHKLKNAWVVSIDFNATRDIAKPKLDKYLTKGYWDYKPLDKMFIGRGPMRGKRIVFKSCDSGKEKFQGTSIDVIWIDEEMTDYGIWQETLMRTLDTGGRIWCTMTPTNGMTWTHDEILEMAGINPDIETFFFNTDDNPHLDVKELERMHRMYEGEEADMRFKGRFISFAGLVYKNFDRRIHVIDPFVIPKRWPRFRTIDHGINNPTACLWVTVNQEDELYIYDEWYETDKTVSENAAGIKVISGGERYAWTTIDPTTQNRDPLSGSNVRKEYQKCGIVTKAFKSDKGAGIGRIKQLLEPNQKTSRPCLFICNTCYATIKEMTRYRWKIWKSKDDKNLPEQPEKVMDHAMDALRYLVMSNPRYMIYEEEQLPKEVVWYK